MNKHKSISPSPDFHSPSNSIECICDGAEEVDVCHSTSADVSSEVADWSVSLGDADGSTSSGDFYDDGAEDFSDDDVLGNSPSEDIPSEDAPSENGMFEHFRLVADKGQSPQRIDIFLSTHTEGTSRSRAQNAIKAGYVLINDKPAKSSTIVRPLDVIKFVMPYRRRGLEILPENIPLNIAYEDDDLLIVNKAAGMVVHPGHGHFSGTLVNALAHHLGITQAPDAEDERMGILVHRIDKDTSGLLVVAKNEETQLKLAEQFFVHSIDRKYIAVVWGDVKEDSGTIEGTIGRDPNDRLRFKVYDDPTKGKHAVTHYRVLERLGYITVVECKLETGRTHQIRVHMSSIGHPLFNDERYGGSEIRQGTVYAKYKQFIKNCFDICPRQALHAKTLGFKHPRSGEWVQFDSCIPEDMSALIEKWRGYTKALGNIE